jgi:hypothetical protein
MYNYFVTGEDNKALFAIPRDTVTKDCYLYFILLSLFIDYVTAVTQWVTAVAQWLQTPGIRCYVAG